MDQVFSFNKHIFTKINEVNEVKNIEQIIFKTELYVKNCFFKPKYLLFNHL